MKNKVPDYITNAEVEEWFDSIDAAVFSGDTFFSKQNCERAIWYAERWLRELKLRQEHEDGEEI